MNRGRDNQCDDPDLNFSGRHLRSQRPIGRTYLGLFVVVSGRTLASGGTAPN